MNIDVKFQEGLTIIKEKVIKGRKHLGIGKKKFGILCGGLSETFIRKLEQGEANPTIKTLVKLKNGLNTTIPEIITRNRIGISSKSITLLKEESYEESKKNFSTRVKKILSHRGINSIDFSACLNMDESATNKYLKGTENPTYLMMLRFAYVLDVNVVDFFDYKGQLPSNDKFKRRYLNP